MIFERHYLLLGFTQMTPCGVFTELSLPTFLGKEWGRVMEVWWVGRTLGTGALIRILSLEKTSKGHLDPSTVSKQGEPRSLHS